MICHFDYSNDLEFMNIINPIISTNNFQYMKTLKHHYNSNVYIHSILVAYNCYRIAKKNVKYNIEELVRGALLHDYFLYDWHIKEGRKGLHGFTHSKEALKNAEKEYSLTNKEKDMILNHMWPLTFFHIPKSREAWLVSNVDKLVTIFEGLRKKEIKKLNLL